MSIAPPSDIILDVAQAADPSRLQAATSRLAKMAADGGTPGASFSAALDASKPTASRGLASQAPAFSPARIETRPTSPYEKFEAVMLQNFLQDVLPKEANLFGDAASADEYRTLLAEQLANQLARSGAIGIAKEIEAAHGGHAQAATLTTPGGAGSTKI